MLANSPQAAATPPISNNARSSTTTSAMVVVRATAVVSHNNQPCITVVRAVVNSRTFVLPIPTNGGRIGTTVTPTVVMLMTITPVGRVANQVLYTTPTWAAPTSWADQLLECTKPSCPWLPAALHLIVAPSSSSALSNVRPIPTTLLEARLGNNQPLPYSMAECHRPTTPTTSEQPWPCQCISLAKERWWILGSTLRVLENMPMMQMGQQLMVAPMLMNHYAPNQQPNQLLGYFWQAGAGSNKLVNSVNTNCRPTPTHNYTLAASILLKTINVDAATIKQWAILDSGATRHFLTTNASATNIVLAAVPPIARLPPTKWWQGAVITHLHSWLARAPGRRPSGPHYTPLSITFVTLRHHYV